MAPPVTSGEEETKKNENTKHYFKVNETKKTKKHN